MKDYYKILGVKEDASADEIRERWIELMQEFHPDHRSGGAGDEEMAKEINEAYQVLKYSSTRMEYDFGRLHQRGLKKFSTRKLILPVSGLTFLLILSFIYFKKPQAPTSSNLKSQLPSSSRGESSSIPNYEPGPYVDSKQSPLKTEKSTKVEMVGLQQMGREMRKDSVVPKKKIEPPLQMADSESTVSPPPFSEEPKHPASIEKQREMKPPETPEKISIIHSTSDQKQSVKLEKQEMRKDSVVPKKKIEPPLQMAHSESAVSPPLFSKEPKHPTSIDKQGEMKPSGTPENISIVHSTSDQKQSVKLEEHITDVKPPLLIATEEEVKRFFADYVERYTQKEIRGFLSLFSPKAIQNQKDGLEGIKRIYDNFFNQSQELRYYMEDTKIEIYQNTVEVNARYEIDQILRKEGEKKIWKGRIQWILVKEDGVLKIISVNYQNEKSP